MVNECGQSMQQVNNLVIYSHKLKSKLGFNVITKGFYILIPLWTKILYRNIS